MAATAPSGHPQQNASSHAEVLDALLASLHTEGLTASSLQQSIHAIDVRREETLRALLSSVSSCCSTPADFASADPLPAEAAVAAATASLLDRGLTEGDDALAQIATLAAEDAALVAELQSAVAAGEEIAAVAKMQQKLADYDVQVAQGAYEAAAKLILEMKGATAGGSGEEAAATVAVEERLTVLRDYVITAPPQYLVIDPGTHLPALHSPVRQTQAALAQVWAAAAVLGVLPDALRNLSTALVDSCVTPLLTAAAQAAAAVGALESPAGSVASSALSAATVAGGGGSSRGAAERMFYRCLKAVCDGALASDRALAAQLGQLLWPAAAGAYISWRLGAARPATDADLEGFVRAGALGVKLEAKAVKLGLWQESIEGPIAKFVRQTVGRVLAEKRTRFVAAARDVLTSSAAKEPVAIESWLPPNSSGKPFPPPSSQRALFGGIAGAAAVAELAGEPAVADVGPYTCTRAAEGLVVLMNDALGDACRSGSPALAQAMCGAVVDMAALLVALEPAGTEQERGLPYVAALRYNDCMHVYRTLCVLPQAHAPRLQTLIHASVNFVAAAKRVRAAGEAALDSMLDRQWAELSAASEELRHWRNLDGPGAIRRNKAVRQLLAGFQRLGSVLVAVLPRAAFINAAAALANAVCGALADGVVALPDISEDESQQIPRILGELTAPAAGLLGAAAAGAGAAAAEYLAELNEAGRDVLRLREVCELLDSPSREIAARWRSGRLAAAGLTREQTASMVRALFEDNEFSRASLNAILTS